MTRNSQLTTINAVSHLLGVMLVVSALFVARDVFIPLTLAILLSFLLSPIVNRIQQYGVKNVWAVMATALFVFIILTGILTFVGRELSNLAADIPRYKTELVTKARELANLRSGLGGGLGDLATEVNKAIESTKTDSAQKNRKDPPASPDPETTTPEASQSQQAEADPLAQNQPQQPGSSQHSSPPKQPHDGTTPDSPLYVSSVKTESSLFSYFGTVGTILGPLGTAGLVTVFVLFLLIYREDLRDRTIKVISGRNYVTTTEALDETAGRISKYLLAQTIVSVSYGFTFSLGLYLIGLTLTPEGHFPNFALWGALAALLRFVPYIGPVSAAAFPILLSLAVFPGYSVTLAVVVWIVVIELACNNILEPWLYGTSTGLSSVAIILAAVFWGWLWGPVGLLLSTPLTVCLVVIGRYVPSFRLFTTLLGEKVDIAPSLRFYQRLLSNNEQRAEELLQNFVNENDALKALDSVIAPAIRRIRTDQDQERLTSKEAAAIDALVEKVSLKIQWAQKPTPVVEPKQDQDPPVTVVADSPKLRAVGMPSHYAGEEHVLKIFSEINSQFEMTVISNDTLPDYAVKQALEQSPAAVIIYVLPPGGMIQARYLCKTFRSSGFQGTIIVCCAGKFRNFDRQFVKVRRSGANYMTTSLTQTAQKLKGMRLLSPLPLVKEPRSLSSAS